MAPEPSCPLHALAAAAAGSAPQPSTASATPPANVACKLEQPRQTPITSSNKKASQHDAWDDKQLPVCWGAQLRGDSSLCTHGFLGGTAHFKNKFCPACKTGSFEVPTSRIRALPRSWNTDNAPMDLKLSLSNGHSVGFWKILPSGEGR